MPVTKITVSTAMRARDVSRPTDEQLAEAALDEPAGYAPGSRAAAAQPQQVQPQQVPPGPAAVPAPPRRRRRRGR